MKSLYNYILLAVMAFATVGCLGELNADIPSAESGDEVQFGLSLPSMTRTTYGDKNATGTAYPIYWVDGDKVQVYSPQCLAGRNNAEYKVSVESATQNYATSLTPTGANGVQWGNEPAMFYSVYPSGDYTILDNGATIQNLKINFMNDFEVWENGVVTPKGADCLMFAKTVGELDPGSTVNLNYSPLATSLMITLRGPSDKSIVSEHTIRSIKLIAPENTFIAGSFNVKLQKIQEGEKEIEIEKYLHTGWSDNAHKSNSITTQVYDKSTGAFHTIKKDEKLEIAMFLAPLTGLTIDSKWKIQVVVQSDIPVFDGNGNVESYKNDVTTTFTKSLAFEKDFNSSLEPGMVHELPALPTLDIAKDPEQEWLPGDWMTNIPRNVYLSEVSIPGTWNSLNVDCQSNTSISDQYDLGVRAFHLDTRWRADNSPFLGSTFTGISRPNITELSVATGGANKTYSYDGGNLMRKEATSTFAEHLKSITDEVQDDEYMVVFCTFAQNSYNGTRCPSTWFGAISNACAANDRVYDASSITANTVVGDVLGKVIVVVNLDSSVSSNTLPTSSKCLFTYVPMQLPADYYDEENSHIDALYYSTQSQTGISMYTSHAQISTTGTSSVNCGDRGYSHPLTSRDNLVKSFWDWSKTNYANEIYEHDKWIYLGLGGYIMTSSSGSGSGYDTVENRYATMIYNRINEMGSNNIPYYPMGIILMNNVKGSNYTIPGEDGNIDLGYNFQGVCKKVLLLNSAYRLQYDPSKPDNYKPAQASAAASYSSGMHDQNVAAFGWD